MPSSVILPDVGGLRSCMGDGHRDHPQPCGQGDWQLPSRWAIHRPRRQRRPRPCLRGLAFLIGVLRRDMVDHPRPTTKWGAIRDVTLSAKSRSGSGEMTVARDAPRLAISVAPSSSTLPLPNRTPMSLAVDLPTSKDWLSLRCIYRSQADRQRPGGLTLDIRRTGHSA